jgi:hypothetical protein
MNGRKFVISRGGTHPGMGSAFHYQGDGLDFWFYVHAETDVPARTMKMVVMEASTIMFAGATPTFNSSDLQKAETTSERTSLKLAWAVMFLARTINPASNSNGASTVLDNTSQFDGAMAESAKRAIMAWQPFIMLRPESHEHWKEMDITFDPKIGF